MDRSLIYRQPIGADMGTEGEQEDSETWPDLTPEDLETIRLAASMGYYESPRRCRMEDIADRLGISKSAVYHRMNKAEREAITWFLEQLGVDERHAEAPEDVPDMVEAMEELLEYSDEMESPMD